MAVSKLLILSIFVALIVMEIRVDAAIDDEVIASVVPDSSLKIELEQLKSKISVLESSIDMRNRELMSKDDRITQMVKIIQEKSDSLASLQKEINSLEVHGAWLPPWLATHLLRCQTFLATLLNEHGKPALHIAIQKALGMKALAEKWAETHMETVRTKWIAVLKEQWLTFTTYVEPHVQSLTTKTVEVYEASKTAITPLIVKDAKKFTKPYIDQVATAMKLHVDKAWAALKPCTKLLVHAYGKFLKLVSTYHHQLQATVQEKMKMHELTRPLATKELVWFAASALLALPVFILTRMCSVIFCKKAKKHTRNAHTNHTRRRAKRGHPDK